MSPSVFADVELGECLVSAIVRRRKHPWYGDTNNFGNQERVSWRCKQKQAWANLGLLVALFVVLTRSEPVVHARDCQGRWYAGLAKAVNHRALVWELASIVQTRSVLVSGPLQQLKLCKQTVMSPAGHLASSKSWYATDGLNLNAPQGT